MQNLIDKLGWGDKGANMALWIGLSVVLLLLVIAIAVWLIRMLRPSLNMGSGSARGGRPQRLAVTDAFSLDRDGRRLVIIRRDNVEHLLLIGGPNDVVVEANITRNERVIRDRATGRGVDADAVQIAESALMGEVAPRHEPIAVQAPPPAPIAAQPAPVAAPTAPAAAPLSLPPLRPLSPAPNAVPPRNPPVKPPPPPVAPPVAVMPASPAPMTAPAGGQKLDEEFERALTAMQAAQRQKLEAQASTPAAPAVTPPAPQPPVVAIPPAPEPTAPQAAPAPQRPARQEPMSEMARRLNEVLQKPLSGQLRPPFNRPIPPVPPVPSKPETPVEAPAVPPALPPLPDLPELPKANQSPPPPATPAAPAARAAETEMDMLEEEMARLLGRPAAPQKSEKT